MLCPHCFTRLEYKEDNISHYAEYICEHCTFGYGQYNTTKEELLNLIHDEFKYSRENRSNQSLTFEKKKKFLFSPLLYHKKLK